VGTYVLLILPVGLTWGDAVLANILGISHTQGACLLGSRGE
jgi:hypothetical protein